MNNAIHFCPALQTSLCSELRDAIVAETASLADARRLNKVLGEGRDVTTWRKAAATHLPHVMPQLTPAQQTHLARHIQASPKHTYMTCERLWDEMDITQLTQAALALADTKDAKALKPKLLLETLERQKSAYDALPLQARVGAACSMDMLCDALNVSLLTPQMQPRNRSQLLETLELTLDSGVTHLPEILKGFDHVTHIVLKSVGDHVDLTLLNSMKSLRKLTLSFAPGAEVSLPSFAGVETQLVALP